MFSQRPKSQRATAFRSARRVPVAKETRNLSLAETQIPDASEILGKETARVIASSERTKISIMVSIFSALGAGVRGIVRGEQVVRDGGID